MRLNIVPEWYYLFRNDMEKLGGLFQFVLTHTDKDLESYMNVFMKSKARVAMENWNCKLQNGSSWDLYVMVEEEMGCVPNNDKDLDYDLFEPQWIGQTYALLRYVTSIPSKELIELIPIEEMRRLYSWGHQVSECNFLVNILENFTYEDYNRLVESGLL